MTVDFKIVKFAYTTFLKAWKYVKLDISKLETSVAAEEKIERGSNEEFQDLVIFRFLLFNKRLTPELGKDYDLYKDNPIDFYHFLRSHMKRYLPYPDMHIVDKLLMSCTVVTVMCAVCDKHNNKDYQFWAPMSWSLYFDTECKEEFYAAGGWQELEAYVERFFCELKTTEMSLLGQSSKSDLENAKMMYHILGKDYCMDEIYETFKQRLKTNCKVFPSCTRCLPLHDVLYSLTSPSGSRVDDFQLVEGYLQIFMRMLDRNDIKDFEKVFMLECTEIEDIEEKTKLARGHTKKTFTAELQRILFRDINKVAQGDHGSSDVAQGDHGSSDVAQGDHESDLCLFCRNKKNKRSISNLTSVIRRTIFQAKFPSTVDSVVAGKEKISTQASRETRERIEEKIVLRRFLAVGTEPILSRVTSHITTEFLSHNMLQDVTKLVDHLEIQEEKPRQTKSKSKKNK